jgi:kynurenine formamidase
MKLAAVIVSLALLSLGCTALRSARPAPPENVVDLTHTLTESFPYIPIPGITFPFKKTLIATIEKMGVAAHRWDIHEHIGTQIDAPSHFLAGGLPLDRIPARKLIAPLAVVDISERARTDVDASLTVEDVRNWEAKHGRLPAGAAVFMYSGWDAKVHDAKAFINLDGSNTMRFPGFSPEAVEFLLRERDVAGIGVDTISVDPGRDKEYKVHKKWLQGDKWVVECAANLKRVPAAGATLFVGATKVEGATGGPVRLIATFPSGAALPATAPSGAAVLSGTWKSAAAEPVGNLGYRTREFRITEDRWKIEVVFFDDRSMTTPIFSFVGEGPYELGGPSIQAPDASNAVFRFDKKLLTLLTGDYATSQRFGFGSCGLIRGLIKDISSTGCANFTSVAACGQEYDLVQVDGDRLRLGARPADGNMCSEDRRPVSLGSPLLRETAS